MGRISSQGNRICRTRGGIHPLRALDAPTQSNWKLWLFQGPLIERTAGQFLTTVSGFCVAAPSLTAPCRSGSTPRPPSPRRRASLYGKQDGGASLLFTGKSRVAAGTGCPGDPQEGKPGRGAQCAEAGGETGPSRCPTDFRGAAGPAWGAQGQLQDAESLTQEQTLSGSLAGAALPAFNQEWRPPSLWGWLGCGKPDCLLDFAAGIWKISGPSQGCMTDGGPVLLLFVCEPEANRSTCSQVNQRGSCSLTGILLKQTSPVSIAKPLIVFCASRTCVDGANKFH